MVCILVAGPPASGKTRLAEQLSRRLALPMMSKDQIKELLYDTVGFRSRAEKVALGAGSLAVLCCFAERMMQAGQPFLLESNFESADQPALAALLERYGCRPVTLCLRAEPSVLYQRYLQRERSPGRHPGHKTNRRYPAPEPEEMQPIPYEQFCAGIKARGMDRFSVGGERIELDVTDFTRLDLEGLVRRLREALA